LRHRHRQAVLQRQLGKPLPRAEQHWTGRHDQRLRARSDEVEERRLELVGAAHAEHFDR
jgi:hypothetical protein